MTMSDLPVEGLQGRPGTSDRQFDPAGLTEAHRHGRRRLLILDQATGCRRDIHAFAGRAPSSTFRSWTTNSMRLGQVVLVHRSRPRGLSAAV